MTHWRLGELDVFFLSYDEKVADAHHAQVQRVSARPVRRVHGVKGLHNAYERAARSSSTDRFITIDADSFVADDTVFRTTLDDDGDPRLVFAFLARNEVNGLRYGNGSVKCWHRRAFENLRTHEHADTGEVHVDFHKALPYRWLPQTGSVNRFATDAFHAFRGGYREGVKLSVGRGCGPRLRDGALGLSDIARSRIGAWTTIGMDVEHGAWAIYGARRSLIDHWIARTLDLAMLNDFDHYAGIWRTLETGAVLPEGLLAETVTAMETLGLPGRWLTAQESAAVKATMDAASA